MNNLVTIVVTGGVEGVLSKLARADIAVYRLKAQGAKVSFCVKEEYVKKVFAIFKHRCYNVGIGSKSAKMRAKEALRRRIGLVVGAVLFFAASVAANFTVLKVKVAGDCAYLADDVIEIARSCGIRQWSACTNADIPSLEAKVLALDGVSFCSVKRRGSYVVIEVMSGGEDAEKCTYSDLVSTEGGKLVRLVAISGTPLAEVGNEVARGDALIGAYASGEDGSRRECLAVGFAEIEVSRRVSVFFDAASEQNASSALGVASLYSDNVTSRSYTLSECDGGVVYDVSFTYISTLSVNME